MSFVIRGPQVLARVLCLLEQIVIREIDRDPKESRREGLICRCFESAVEKNYLACTRDTSSQTYTPSTSQVSQRGEKFPEFVASHRSCWKHLSCERPMMDQ